MVHHIETTASPSVYSKLRRLVPERLKQVKAEFEMMIEQGLMHAGIEKPTDITTARRTEEGWRHTILRRLSCVTHRTFRNSQYDVWASECRSNMPAIRMKS